MEIFDCFFYYCEGGYVSDDDEGEDKSAGALSYVGTAAYEVLRKKHNRNHHQCWNVTTGTVVRLHQTPRDGFQPRQAEYSNTEYHDQWFPEEMGELIARTEIWCDVMSLAPPDGLFLTSVQEGIKRASYRSIGKEKPVIIRILFGNIPSMPVHCNKLIKKFTQEIPQEANIHVWVGAWRRGSSWNHAKIVAVDGKYLHTGGHNMWSEHYLKHKPTYDLSIELRGRVAHDGHMFANKQWSFIKFKQDTPCGRFVDKLPDNMILMAKTRVTISEYPRGKAGEFAPLYTRDMIPKYPPDEYDEGRVPILSLGRYGAILRYPRPSDDAFVALFGAAKKIIRLALQDLGPVCLPNCKIPVPGYTWPKRYLSAIAQVMYERGVQVEIVLSNPSSIPGDCKVTEACYGNGWNCVDVAAELIKRIKKLHPTVSLDKLRTIATNQLRVCFIRNASGTNQYSDGMTIGNHTKHFIIDDLCVYIGSQNLYLCDLAEWGVLIDDAAQTKKIMEDFWIPCWQCSFTGEDCDVDRVMNGLKVNREQDASAASAATTNMVETPAMQYQGAMVSQRRFPMMGNNNNHHQDTDDEDDYKSSDVLYKKASPA